MHTTLSNLAYLGRRADRLLWLGTLCVGAALLTPIAAHGQTFVAEWAEADIGRIGPTGLALDTVGSSTYLYVSDQPMGRILKIDVATGNRVAVWGQTGNGPLEFNSPYGIAVDPASHDLYIAERGNNRVQRITNNGTFVMGWGVTGTAAGQFESPIGIAADAQGNVYVVDHDNDRVEKFHVQQTSGAWNAQFVTAWGGPGGAQGQFDHPYGVTLDAQGNVWVADGGNHRLQKFDPNGRFLASVGSYGTADGQFITPTWVNFDAAGNLYVAETNSDPQNLSAPDLQNQLIKEFGPDGTFIKKWGSYGEAGGQFKLPFDIVVDAAGNAYVSDYYNTRLQVFSLNSSTGTGGGGGGGGTSDAHFVNVSSMLRLNASRPLIAGFVVSGSTPKQLLIRAVGPTLTTYGVTGTLPNPSLQVFSGTKVIASNDDWAGDASVSAAATKLGAFSLPATSKDAALLVTLAPGVYSAQVGDNGGDGVALVEVYDADGSATSKLINLSTRGYIGTADGSLSAGFVVNGTTPKRVMIRGVGKTLVNFGVTDAVADAVLKVYKPGGVVIAQNDNWETVQTVAGGPTPGTAADVSAAETSTGAFTLPAGSTDAAIVLSLPPGSYSAVVTGAGGATGTALVEVYEIP